MRENQNEHDDQPNDPVWSLLDRAPMAEPDGWFAARTVARLLRENEKKSGWLARWRSVVLLAGTVGVACLGLFLYQGEVATGDSSTPHRAQIQEAFAYLADGTQDTEIWPDSSL